MSETPELTAEEIDEGQGGRPPFEPTEADRAWVQNAASVGMPQEIICMRVFNPQSGKPIALKTLRKHFRVELDMAMADYGQQLLTTGFSIATDKEHGSCAYMNQFLCKTRLGMKETTVSEITGADGQAFPQLLVIKNGNGPSQD